MISTPCCCRSTPPTTSLEVGSLREIAAAPCGSAVGSGMGVDTVLGGDPPQVIDLGLTGIDQERVVLGAGHAQRLRRLRDPLLDHGGELAHDTPSRGSGHHHVDQAAPYPQFSWG